MWSVCTDFSHSEGEERHSPPPLPGTGKTSFMWRLEVLSICHCKRYSGVLSILSLGSGFETGEGREGERHLSDRTGLEGMGWGWAEKMDADIHILGSGRMESNFSRNNLARLIRQKEREQRLDGLERSGLVEECRFHQRYIPVSTLHTRAVADSASGWC